MAYLGEIVPGDNGRISWPLARMAPGDWFVVPMTYRSIGQVRNLVKARSADLGRPFSVTQMPNGSAKVTARLATRGQKVREVLYGHVVNLVREKFGVNISGWNWFDADLMRHGGWLPSRPLEDLLVFYASPNRYVLEMFRNGFAIHRIADDATFEDIQAQILLG